MIFYRVSINSENKNANIYLAQNQFFFLIFKDIRKAAKIGEIRQSGWTRKSYRTPAQTMAKIMNDQSRFVSGTEIHPALCTRDLDFNPDPFVAR